MNIDNIGRFLIKKNAIDFLKTNNHKGITKNKDLAYFFNDLEYNGNEEFKKYQKIDEKKIKKIIELYKDNHLILENMYWDYFFSNSKYNIDILLKKLARIKENSIIILNFDAIEMAIIGTVFKELGIKNTIFSFNKNYFINSIPKTTEGVLFLYYYKNYPFLIEKIKEIVNNIKKEQINIPKEKLFIVLNENDFSKTHYFYSKLDDYIKSQIGLVDSQNIKRIDNYFSNDFKEKYHIKNILTIDEKYNGDYNKTFGYYEDYLLKKNKEYLKYRSKISIKALTNYDLNSSNYNNKINTSYDYNYSKSKKSSTLEAEYFGFYIYIILLIVYGSLLLINYYSGENSGSGGSGGGYYHYSNYGNHYSSDHKNTHNNSKIKSFGGGGFHKGGFG